jgi:hypothetical protein
MKNYKNFPICFSSSKFLVTGIKEKWDERVDRINSKGKVG